MWVQIALFVASLIISYALQPKQTQAKPATADDFDFPTTDDGTPKCVVFGDVWITGWCVIGVGNYRNEGIYQKQKSLFGSKRTRVGYRYFMSIHMGVCLGMDDLVEIKVSDSTAWTGTIPSDNKTSIYINKPDLFGGDDSEGGIQGNLIIMRGAADQAALPELEAMLGTVPAYRGCVTFFYDGLICSNSPYPKEWSFRVRRTTTGWDGSVWYPEKATIWLSDNTIKAMNPAHIIYEAQTNSVWGRGNSASQIDVASFRAVADQLYSENFGMCIGWRRQDNVGNFIQEVLDHIGAALFVDRTTGLWKLVLIRDNYDVSTLPSFNYSTGLLRLEEDNNASSDLVTNQTIVTFTDPVSNETQTTRAENLAAIQKFGIIMETKTYTGLPTADLAGRVAARDMKIAQSGLKKFKVVLDRRAYALQPASVFKLNLPDRGIESIVVRAVRVEHDVITNGEITVTVVQDVFGLPATNYISEQPSLWQPPNYQALPVQHQKLFELPYAELLQDFSQPEVNNLAGNYVSVLAQQPSKTHLNFDIQGKLASETTYADLGEGEYAFVSAIASDIAQSANSIVVELLQSISANVVAGDRAYIDDEILTVESIDRTLNTFTLFRGCIDTIPVAHSAGAYLWIYSNIASTAERLFTATSMVSLRLITRTTQEELAAAQALVSNFTLNQRLLRPLPPCNVKVNGLYFPDEISGDLTLSWSNRNRLTQTNPAQLGWHNSSVSAEAGTTYNVRIFDADNAALLNASGITANEFYWAVPKKFVGDLETQLDLSMNGASGWGGFVDSSDNAFTVTNNGVAIQADSTAIGGSAASFGYSRIITNQSAALDIYSSDHCVEFKIKTASSDYLYADTNMEGKYPSRIVISVEPSAGYYWDYTVIVRPFGDALSIQLQGERAGAGAIAIVENVQGLSPDTYYDVAVNAVITGSVVYDSTGSVANVMELTIYVNGTSVKTGIFHTRSPENGCYCSVVPERTKGHTEKFSLAGLRVTKKTGGRYSGNYTPAPFAIGSSDPYWDNVVLLMPMSGSNNSMSILDVSAHAHNVTNGGAVFIKADSAAPGGSATYFYYPRFTIPYHAALDLRGKSFIIEGRMRTNLDYVGGLDGVSEIFNFFGQMWFSCQKTGAVLFNSESSVVAAAYGGVYSGTNTDTPNPYEWVDFKIVRDADTGEVTITLDDTYSATASFNPGLKTSEVLSFFGSFGGGYQQNGFKLQTVSGDAGTVPNVVNPLRIELESERDGLTSWQAYTSTVAVQ